MGSGVLGACAAQVLRPACQPAIATHPGGVGTDRRTVCDRSRDSRQSASAAPRSSANPESPLADRAAHVADRPVEQAIAQIRNGGSGTVRAEPLGGVAALRRRWADRDRQQCRRARTARGRIGTEELPVSGLGRGR